MFSVCTQYIVLNINKLIKKISATTNRELNISPKLIIIDEIIISDEAGSPFYTEIN